MPARDAHEQAMGASSARASSSAPRSRAGRARSARCRAGAGRPRSSRSIRMTSGRHARNDNRGTNPDVSTAFDPITRLRHEVGARPRRRPSRSGTLRAASSKRATGFVKTTWQWATRWMRCSSSPAALLPNHTWARAALDRRTGIAQVTVAMGKVRPRPRGRLLHRLAGRGSSPTRCTRRRSARSLRCAWSKHSIGDDRPRRRLPGLSRTRWT